jgi:HprK-related kinase A
VIVQDLSAVEISQYLTTTGLSFRAGSFTVNVHSDIATVASGISTLYGESEIITKSCDFNISLEKSPGLRKYIKPQVQFYLNGIEPFSPLPFSQALPLLEWGLNWCVTNYCHEYLIIHAAVVEKNGFALILPGQPGAGKSTLCAALVEVGGWRLLSDELTIAQLDGERIQPNPRPTSLKNQSIEVVKSFTCAKRFTPTVHDTLKGSVAHLKPLSNSISQFNKPAIPALIVYPKYELGVEPCLSELSKGESFIRMADHSFNYSILGVVGFNALAKLHDKVKCYEFHYGGDIEQAIATMDSLL